MSTPRPWESPCPPLWALLFPPLQGLLPSVSLHLHLFRSFGSLSRKPSQPSSREKLLSPCHLPSTLAASPLVGCMPSVGRLCTKGKSSPGGHPCFLTVYPVVGRLKASYKNLILKPTLGDKYTYHPHFTDEEN